jgi:peptide/nickel transport system permease protein
MYHFDEPTINQFYYWLINIFQGNWGYSASYSDMPVTQVIAHFFPATFELALLSTFMAVIIGIFLGTLSAVRRDKPIDQFTRVTALLGVSLPIFVFGLLLQYIFFYQLGWLPAIGRYDAILFMQYSATFHNYTGFFLIDCLLNGNMVMFIDGLKHLILPATALAAGAVALITRLMRSSMLEVLSLDYVKTARSKGLPEKVVINKHARRNALIPTTTVVGMMFGGLLGGAVLTETIFVWPGLGRWSTQAITSLDTISIMGFVLLTAFIFILSNLVVDILYAYLDPRVKLG